MLLSDSSTELVGFRSDTQPQSEVYVRCTIGFVIFSHSPVKLCPVCSLWIAAVCPFMWLHQSSPLNPKLWPLSQWGEGLCPPARTTGMPEPLGWFVGHHRAERLLTPTDTTFNTRWRCVTLCLLNGPASPPAPLPHSLCHWLQIKGFYAHAVSSAGTNCCVKIHFHLVILLWISSSVALSSNSKSVSFCVRCTSKTAAAGCLVSRLLNRRTCKRMEPTSFFLLHLEEVGAFMRLYIVLLQLLTINMDYISRSFE